WSISTPTTAISEQAVGGDTGALLVFRPLAHPHRSSETISGAARAGWRWMRRPSPAIPSPNRSVTPERSVGAVSTPARSGDNVAHYGGLAVGRRDPDGGEGAGLMARSAIYESLAARWRRGEPAVLDGGIGSELQAMGYPPAAAGTARPVNYTWGT